eukprot:764135-Hanusia_phi.AAC.4
MRRMKCCRSGDHTENLRVTPFKKSSVQLHKDVKGRDGERDPTYTDTHNTHKYERDDCKHERFGKATRNEVKEGCINTDFVSSPARQ